MAKQSLDDVIIRFTATHAHFTRPTNEVTVTCRLRCSVKWEQIFNEYKMDGYSTEENEMYLRVKIDHLKNAVAHIEKSTIVSLKLDNGSSDQGPVLLIILETGLSTVCNKRIVKQQVPIVVVSHRRWVDYIEDPLPSYKVRFFAFIVNYGTSFTILVTIFNFPMSVIIPCIPLFIKYRFR